MAVDTIELCDVGLGDPAITYCGEEDAFEITRTSDEIYELWIAGGPDDASTVRLYREQLETLRDGITQALAAL